MGKQVLCIAAEYYLHRDVHGDYSFYGTPFLDVRCKTDSDNLIIYGHNINGSCHRGKGIHKASKAEKMTFYFVYLKTTISVPDTSKCS